jgi:tetratricopeptide (TPR) repeat protein
MDHPDVATSLQNLAKILADESKIPEAETLYRQVLALRRKLLGDEHPDVAQTLDSLAGTLQDRGSLGEAESIYRAALSTCGRAKNQILISYQFFLTAATPLDRIAGGDSQRWDR